MNKILEVNNEDFDCRVEACVTKNNKTYNLKKNQSIDIPRGAKHRIENKEKTSLTIVEIQTGDKLLENDIIRFEDVYNRN